MRRILIHVYETLIQVSQSVRAKKYPTYMGSVLMQISCLVRAKKSILHGIRDNVSIPLCPPLHGVRANVSIPPCPCLCPKIDSIRPRCCRDVYEQKISGLLQSDPSEFLHIFARTPVNKTDPPGCRGHTHTHTHVSVIYTPQHTPSHSRCKDTDDRYLHE
jgi:hypothetical protein